MKSLIFLRIIATPGRFMHLCIEMDLKLHDVKYVVFDEADRYDQNSLFF
jgi:superfamily II DNA/RNA helicase